MPSEARQKKIMEKINRAQKCSILGAQNPGSGGAQAPGAPLDPHLGVGAKMSTDTVYSANKDGGDHYL